MTADIDQVNDAPVHAGAACDRADPGADATAPGHAPRSSPPAQGEYWVAAGISFTSFVLVNGEILVTVQFGDGLEIAVLGLARAQLPDADAHPGRRSSSRCWPGSRRRKAAARAGAAHRELVRLSTSRSTYRRLRLPDLVEGPERRPVRHHGRRVPPTVPPRRIPRGAAGRVELAADRQHQHRRRRLLRAVLRGDDGRGRPAGRGPPRPGACAAWTSAATAIVFFDPF